MSIWTGLLFHHGHVGNVDLARSLAETPPTAGGADGGMPAHGGEGVAPLPPCAPAFPNRGVASLCAVALSQFR